MIWRRAAQRAATNILEKDNPWSMDYANERIKYIASEINGGHKFIELQQLSDFIGIGSAAAHMMWDFNIYAPEDIVAQIERRAIATADFLEKKHLDYSPHNILRFGTLGVWVRISDKMARWENLAYLDNDKINFEGLADTYKDTFGYCIIGIMLLDGTFLSPVAEGEVIIQ